MIARYSRFLTNTQFLAIQRYTRLSDRGIKPSNSNFVYKTYYKNANKKRNSNIYLNHNNKIRKMKKTILFFVLILFNALLANAQDDWFYNSQNLIIGVNVSSGADIKPKAADYNVDYIKVNLSHYPYQSFNQEVMAFDLSPEAKKENNALLFEWQNPKDEISFGYKAKIRTSNNIIKITKKIPFPITDLPEDLKPFFE